MEKLNSPETPESSGNKNFGSGKEERIQPTSIRPRKSLWKRFQHRAIESEITQQDALEQAIELWLNQEETSESKPKIILTTGKTLLDLDEKCTIILSEIRDFKSLVEGLVRNGRENRSDPYFNKAARSTAKRLKNLSETISEHQGPEQGNRESAETKKKNRRLNRPPAEGGSAA